MKDWPVGCEVVRFEVAEVCVVRFKVVELEFDEFGICEFGNKKH